MTTPRTVFTKTIDNLQDFGRSWASTGLEISKSALEATSRSLNATAQYLADLTEKLNPPAPAEAVATEAAVSEPAKPEEAAAEASAENGKSENGKSSKKKA